MKIRDEFEFWLQNNAPAGALGDESEYPIAGCREVIARAEKEVRELGAHRILCVGAGSEIAARNLAMDGCDVWIADDSMERLKLLSRTIPGAHYIYGDIFDLMPDSVYKLKFDAIICTYIMHTAGDDERIWSIEDLFTMLTPGGSIIIGDICFWTSAEREICRRRCSQLWDDEASYIVYDEFRRMFDDECIRFSRISHCSGIIVLGGLEDEDYDEDDYYDDDDDGDEYFDDDEYDDIDEDFSDEYTFIDEDD